MTILDAKVKLEAEGLYASCNDANSLWIAANVRDVGDGVKLSEDACVLTWISDRWVAIFPAHGQQTYEVPGALEDLVSLITTIYTHYRGAGGQFKDAFTQVVGDPEQYLGGRSPARV